LTKNETFLDPDTLDCRLRTGYNSGLSSVICKHDCQIGIPHHRIWQSARYTCCLQ